MPPSVGDLATPALIVDLDRVEANLRRVQAYADAQGVDLRPHVKTHKTPRFARAQLDGGAVGLCVAKLGEAEAFADAGFDDLVMPHTVATADKAARAVALAQRVRFAIGVDHPAQVAVLAAAAEGAARRLDVRLEVDTGAGRGGAPAEAVADLARRVRDAAGLRLAGVYTYEGYTYEARDRDELVARHDAAQVALLEVAATARPFADGAFAVSVGSTPSALAEVPLRPGITETRPGTYVFDDLTQARWAGGLEHAAAHVLATVVSVLPGRAVLDAGSKTLTSDRRPVQDGHGWLVDHRLPVVRLSEEHGVVEGPGVERLRVGERVRVLMNHVCPVANLFAELHLVREDVVVGVVPVAARGRLT
ncbi:MAG: alanine racemase [Trueperaceae bacterium]|nr:alanine racemase [Trueperaceae bacterium]